MTDQEPRCIEFDFRECPYCESEKRCAIHEAVDRKVREAAEAEREACCKAIRDACTACDGGHSGERHADGTSIECMYCGVPIRAIRARNQPGETEKGTI